MTNIPNIIFKKVTDKNNTLFDQTQFYEDNFEKINTLIVPKVNELDGAIGEAEGRLELAEADLDNHEGRIDTVELNKVDKVPGKGLSTNDFTTALKTKLETDIPAQLAEKVQNFKLKNEVVNGDFSQGTTGWRPLSSTLEASANEITITSESDSDASYITIRSVDSIELTTIGEKIYFRAKIKMPITGQILRLGSYSYYDNVSSQIISSDNYNLISAVVTSTSLFLDPYIAPRSGGFFKTGASYKVKEFIAIRLSVIFGVGNEPTKLEMDELMKVIPNQWWGGELTLTQKQVVTWQLNLIRKNTNAIIALGGTII